MVSGASSLLVVRHPARSSSRTALALDEAFGYLKRVNPLLTDADRIDAKAGRLLYAQPVCPPGFGAMIPKTQTPVAGLQVADTCYYYPEDRCVSEGVRWAKLMAAAIDNPSIWDKRYAIDIESGSLVLVGARTCKMTANVMLTRVLNQAQGAQP